MKKLFFTKLFFLLVLFSGCETIKNKSDEIVKKIKKSIIQITFIALPLLYLLYQFKLLNELKS